jgi:NAD(P)H-hydrate repair Nnr-like enzyme with NAD(P)H-hydrate dehydratase domain
MIYLLTVWANQRAEFWQFWYPKSGGPGGLLAGSLLGFLATGNAEVSLYLACIGFYWGLKTS